MNIQDKYKRGEALFRVIRRACDESAVMHQGRLVDRLPRPFAPGPSAHPVLSELINAILPAAPKAVKL